AYGGTGARADLDLAAEAVSRFPRLTVTLAGGLEPDNVAEAIRLVRPYAVDVASGVESAPGRKDPFKMRDFVQAALGAL
ncbi:MAG: N-(5'-phosphoribosyl)anthranilate isomerase, partial [Chthoniobacterales bacterium]|nr:N-(5'-phosphoribosyl)anthranilate isomerase [Chthoniobacterales bacterium]